MRLTSTSERSACWPESNYRNFQGDDIQTKEIKMGGRARKRSHRWRPGWRPSSRDRMQRSCGTNGCCNLSYDTALPPKLGPRAAETLAAGRWSSPAGRLAARARGFIYVGQKGFLESRLDERAHAFAFLRSRGVRVVCCFVGGNLRSPRLLREMAAREQAWRGLGSRLELADPVYGTEAHEEQKREIARVADEYADLIYGAPTDQMTYLARPTLPSILSGRRLRTRQRQVRRSLPYRWWSSDSDQYRDQGNSARA